MNNQSKRNRATWFPGTSATYDRWGDAVNSTLPAKEFAPRAEPPEAIVNRMRWSLGLM